MILGVGTDICNENRIKKSLDKFGDKFIEKICTKTEQEVLFKKANISSSLAKIFAAKEACVKAIGTGISAEVTWQDIEIYHNTKGKPFVKLSQRAKQSLVNENINIEISISDDEPYAVAFVIIEGLEK
ncbi:MAG: holo-ACP synthase [Alphaproteobacteria bacterium]